MPPPQMIKHISEQFDTELDALRARLMEMGGLVERQIQQSCRALITHDIALAEETRSIDKEVNRYEIEIDERVINIIARRQPTAVDLRMVICIMKASADLERIGDESDRIAKMAIGMGRQAFPEDQYKHIRTLSEQVTRMVRDALDAFARGDADAALEVIAADRQVDQEYKVAVAKVLADLRQEPEHAERSINTLWTARALERIGDHAKNIGEQVVFQVRGEDVRHSDHPPTP
ncbi:MAG: phosphate signaling complex protein PhoU [Pseudomonadota bacterium]